MSPDRMALIAAARATRFVREEPKGSNGGQGVEAMLAGVGLPKGQPWCAAAVAWWGVAALGARWPLPKTGGCAVLGDAAAAKGWLVAQPEVGDVFLIWFDSLKRFGHTGLVTDAGTIEGNAAGGGDATREGWGVFEKVRHWRPEDRFIRWAA